MLKSGLQIVSETLDQILEIPASDSPHLNQMLQELFAYLLANLELRKSEDLGLDKNGVSELAIGIIDAYARHWSIIPSDVIAFLRLQYLYCKDPITEEAFLRLLGGLTKAMNQVAGNWKLETFPDYHECYCGCGGNLIYDSLEVPILQRNGIFQAANSQELFLEQHGLLPSSGSPKSVWDNHPPKRTQPVRSIVLH